MQHGIREFRPRQPLDRQLSSDTLNRILRELESLRITRVVNGTFKKLPGGTEIVVAPQRAAGSGTTAAPQPFKISSFVDPDDDSETPSYLVTVHPGTINGLLPTNILEGDALEQFSLPNNSLRYVVLNCVAANNTLTSCSISLETNAPAQQTPLAFALPATYKALLGIVRNSSVYQIATDNITVGAKQAWIVNRDNAPAGALPYEAYLMWG